MPSKSKRNRRISPNKKEINTTDLNNGAVASAVAAQPVKSSVAYSGSSKQTASLAQITTNFGRDLRWIGVVTVIMIILIVLSYIFFH
jgi:hypothetical protein